MCKTVSRIGAPLFFVLLVGPMLSLVLCGIFLYDSAGCCGIGKMVMFVRDALRFLCLSDSKTRMYELSGQDKKITFMLMYFIKFDWIWVLG